MTKPDENNNNADKETSQAETPADSPKKAAADPGVIEHDELGEGSGSSAAATGAEPKPVDSTLVGDGSGGLTGAERREDRDDPEDARGDMLEGAADPVATDSMAAATASGAGTDDGEPAGDAQEDPVRDAPAGAILRETPASVPAPIQNITVQKTGFWPVLLGGVLAAGLGAGATIWALPHLPPGWLPDPEPSEPAAQVVDAEAIKAEAISAAEQAARDAVAAAAPIAAPDDLQTLLDAQAQRIDQLAASLEALPAAAPATGAAAAPDSALGATVEELKTWLEQQATQIEDLTARPSLDEAVAAKIESLAANAEALQQQIQTAAQQAQEQITAAQEQASKLQEAAADSTRRAEAVAAIANLKAALDRGVTSDEAAGVLEGSGIDTPEALQRDIPSLEQLQTGFGDAARDALRASLREDSAAGGGNVLMNYLRAQTGIRSVEPREGDDADAIVSRANAEVEAGDIAAALTQLDALSDTARSAPAMAAWLDSAQAYRDAQTALTDLSADTN